MTSVPLNLFLLNPLILLAQHFREDFGEKRKRLQEEIHQLEHDQIKFRSDLDDEIQRGKRKLEKKVSGYIVENLFSHYWFDYFNGFNNELNRQYIFHLMAFAILAAAILLDEKMDCIEHQWIVFSFEK